MQKEKIEARYEMNFSKDMQICGFTVERVRRSEELHGALIEMSHQTGAKLCWLDNGESNKFFSVAFQTLPEDHTGVFHILEHSVLCGSEGYPVKEPFVEMLKSSMNTFLNAMTYPDKTVFPVSSRNEKDFLNLVSVYLDAVFSPLLVKNPNIFYQEGWHIETEEDAAYYNGVVFNEMKGDMSNLNTIVMHGMEALLFPDNCYRFNSGGNPADIPRLSYEQFTETYHRFYHPANARFFLDGDIPLEKTLSMIDHYLCRYSYRANDFELSLQKPVSGEAWQYYEIAKGEETEHRAVLAMGKIIGTWEQREKLLAAQVLCSVLTDTNEAVLKRAVLDSGLAANIEASVGDGIAQPYFMITVYGMKDSDSKKVRRLIRETVEKLIADGLDRSLIEAAINRLSFQVRQAAEPKGLLHALTAFNSWMYGGDPMQYLVYDEAFAALREWMNKGGFEVLLKELFLDDAGLVILHTLPSVTLGEEQQKAEEDELDARLSGFTQEQMEELCRQNERLHQWQNTVDTPEQLAALPGLDLSEVSNTPEFFRTVQKSENDTVVLYHDVPSQGIVYLSMYFPLTAFSIEELTRLSFVTALYGELPTKQHNVRELQQEIRSRIGFLNIGMEVFGEDQKTDCCTPCLAVHAGMLAENFEQAQLLIAEILTQTLFEQPEKIRQIAVQMEEDERQAAVTSGHSLAAGAVRAHYTACDAVGEAVNGFTFIRFLHELVKNFDNSLPELLSLTARMQCTAVCKANLTVSVSASKEYHVSTLLSCLPEGKKAPGTAQYRTALPEKMGIRIPAPVGYAVKGYHLSNCNTECDGSMRVAANILSLEYLWNAVRVQGGAYGSGFSIERDGGMSCYSFRDPSPSASVQAFDKMAEFLREYCSGDEDFDRFIISAVAATEPLRTPMEQGLAADEQWFSGLTNEQRLKNRRQMLAADREALLGWCDALDKMAEEGAVCIVASDEELKAFDGLTVFDA